MSMTSGGHYVQLENEYFVIADDAVEVAPEREAIALQCYRREVENERRGAVRRPR